jgi:hypothetical protein
MDWRLFYRTVLCMATGEPDTTRWSNDASYPDSWDERTRLISSLLPAQSRVIEFGAARRRLEQYLDPTCTYIPSDLVDRGSGTFVCDLNRRPLPDLSPLGADVAVFAGVLEYLVRLQEIPLWLRGHVPTCIASYEISRSVPGGAGRLRERFERARIGWVNTYSEAEFIDLFARGGFRCDKKIIWYAFDGDEPIYRFRARQ